MHRDEDFTAYMGGRWGTLVRSAVLLGCAQPDAEDVVQTTLARCYAAWPKVSRAVDRETADALGIAAGTVKSRTSRALAALAGNEHLADIPDGKAP